jgi:ABC-type transport system involved in Fe-S cluster assembly fused permease/ATPase subunit
MPTYPNMLSQLEIKSSFISGIYSPLTSTDISEEHVVAIFKVEEQAKQEIDMKQVASNGVEDIASQNVEFFITAAVGTSNHRKITKFFKEVTVKASYDIQKMEGN